MRMPTLLAAASTSVEVNPWMILPFGVLLFLIAAGPLFFEKWWHHQYPKVAVGLGLITVCYYLFILNNGGRLLHVAHEYVSFIALIGSLFVVAGGIHITVKGESRPFINVVFLFLGAVIANLIGTTGASMLMIRPWIRMNRYRITSFHVVFFIFIVSNVGGCLTPVGDPPLFLGFLKGVPFLWVLENLWVAWLIAVAILLGVVLGRIRLVNELLDPVIELLRYLSPTAMIPIAVIWFGIGETSKYFLIFWGTFFIVLVNTTVGVMRAPVIRQRAAECLGASQFQIFVLVVIPSAAPYIVTGMRIAMASSFMSIIPAEILAADSGIGFLLQNSSMLMQTNRIFVALLAICLLGFAFDRLFRIAVDRILSRYMSYVSLT